MSTKTKSNRKTYDQEFKKQAVQLVITSGRPLTQMARELGVSPWNLRDWRARLQPELAQHPKPLKRCACGWPNWNVTTSSCASNATF